MASEPGISFQIPDLPLPHSGTKAVYSTSIDKTDRKCHKAMALLESVPRGDRETALPYSMLIFDMEALTGYAQVGAAEDFKPCPRDCELQRSMQVLAAPQTHFEARLLRDVRASKKKVITEEGGLDTVVLATHLAAIGYRVAVRTALGGGNGQECFNNLNYEFLLVTDEHCAIEYVVDARFREQFHIPHGTPAYTALLLQVPEEFVGSPARLRPMVKLLCGQMQAAFEANGLTCPPWRRAQGMISKWAPAKARDVEVASPSSSPEAQHSKGLDGLSPRGPLSRCNSDATASSAHSSARVGRNPSPTPPPVVAQPLVRQAGFQPSRSQSLGPERQHTACVQAKAARSHSFSVARVAASKENCRDRWRGNASTGPANLDPLRDRPTGQPQDFSLGLGWHAPKIRTVKMAGAHDPAAPSRKAVRL